MTPTTDIARLVHRYADAVVRRDAEQWGACWAPDGRWTLVPGHEVTGRDEIVELWERAMAGFAAVVQLVHNGEARLDADRGEGRWYLSEHARRANGGALLTLAHYDDTYVLGEGGWRFASRSLVVHYHGPPDLSGTFGGWA